MVDLIIVFFFYFLLYVLFIYNDYTLNLTVLFLKGSCFLKALESEEVPALVEPGMDVRGFAGCLDILLGLGCMTSVGFVEVLKC